jgi:hypothetical protein
MPTSVNKCRDCRLCTQRGIMGFAKKTAKVGLAVGTLGTSVVASKVINIARKMCPVCGHAMSEHSIVDGRFKD